MPNVTFTTLLIPPLSNFSRPKNTRRHWVPSKVRILKYNFFSFDWQGKNQEEKGLPFIDPALYTSSDSLKKMKGFKF